MNSNDELKRMLEQELGYLPGSNIDLLLSKGVPKYYQRGSTIIECGKLCDDVFIISKGIMRFVDMNGDRERTFAFALPGTVFFSKHSFVMSLPSYYQVEACCDCELLVISRRDFWQAAEQSHELALWLLRYAHGELFYQEYKNSAVHNGTAAERYRKMIADRPAIIRNVSQKIIASYLGVTPEYLSRLKRDLINSEVK
ncbi:MAG: Crp/Fnr family transcriptional regulator [Muribaculaceae bacterium]|nr:Crp/Fnr family transcriptional regulator [Bacteroides sp.]MDE6680875.1 Crp/Fnr family transcriptional regulator [Muribaculaceae bacterium]MDE6842826.1 Crp/Fnr family transcriptional regulator [Muribaculaceae bacterium]